MTSQDYDIDDLSCPHCNHFPLHSRPCTEIACNDGSIDESEEDFLLPDTKTITCSECKGTGLVRWCPGCGADLSGYHFEEVDDIYQ